jgi:hypothetical protein
MKRYGQNQEPMQKAALIPSYSHLFPDAHTQHQQICNSQPLETRQTIPSMYSSVADQLEVVGRAPKPMPGQRLVRRGGRPRRGVVKPKLNADRKYQGRRYYERRQERVLAVSTFDGEIPLPSTSSISSQGFGEIDPTLYNGEDEDPVAKRKINDMPTREASPTTDFLLTLQAETHPRALGFGTSEDGPPQAILEQAIVNSRADPIPKYKRGRNVPLILHRTMPTDDLETGSESWGTPHKIALHTLPRWFDEQVSYCNLKCSVSVAKMA